MRRYELMTATQDIFLGALMLFSSFSSLEVVFVVVQCVNVGSNMFIIVIHYLLYFIFVVQFDNDEQEIIPV